MNHHIACPTGDATGLLVTKAWDPMLWALQKCSLLASLLFLLNYFWLLPLDGAMENPGTAFLEEDSDIMPMLDLTPNLLKSISIGGPWLEVICVSFNEARPLIAGQESCPAYIPTAGFIRDAPANQHLVSLLVLTAWVIHFS